MCTFWIHFSSFGALALYSLVVGVFGCLRLIAVCSVFGISVLVNSLLFSFEAVSYHVAMSVANPGG